MEKERLEFFQNNLENVNAWLQYIEAKNAALVAFNIAVLTAISSSDLFASCKIIFVVIIIGLLISTILLLCSFKPINKGLTKTDGKGIDVNLLHYAYVASLDQDEHIKKLYNLYWGANSINSTNMNNIPQIEKDYSEEIIQNSRITIKKQSYFRKAFHIDIIMIFLTIVLIIFALT